MRRRLIASVFAWLIAGLIVCPFTAPFSSCDLSTLLPQKLSPRIVVVHADGAMASMASTNDQSSLGSFLEEKRFKEIAIGAAGTLSVAVPHPVSLPTTSVRSSVARLPLIALRL